MRNYDPSKPLFSIHVPKAGGSSFRFVLDQWFNSFNFPYLNSHPRLFKLLTPWSIDIMIQHLLGCGLYYHYANHQFNKRPRRIKLGGRYGLLLRRKPECVHGHFEKATDGGDLFDFYPEAQQFITFLRDPLDLQLSLFFYRRRIINQGGGFWGGRWIKNEKEFNDFMDVDKWLEQSQSYMLEYFPWRLTDIEFKAVIDKNFIHIGVVEDFQKGIDILAEKLLKKPSGVEHRNVSERFISHSESSSRIFKEKHKLEYQVYEYARMLNK